MNRFLSFWHQPTLTFEVVLLKRINWWSTLFLFGCNGILYVHVVMKSGGYHDVSSGKMFFATTMTMISLGTLYGIVSNLIVGYLIKLTGRFFGASNDLKTIYNAMTWAYLPASICVVLLLLNLFIARSLLTDPATVPDLILSVLIIIFSFLQFILGIWQFILLYKGLKVAQELSRIKTILNYVSGAAIFGIVNYILIY